MSNLYHGTSRKIADRILEEGLIPNGTDSTHRYHNAAMPRGCKPADPKHVYLISTFHHAVMFGYVRVMGHMAGGKFKVFSLVKGRKGRRYDDIIVFVIDERCLDKHLFRESDLYKGETAYQGIIPSDALTHMLCIPVTKKLEMFIASMHSEALRKYVGIDLVEHLGAKTLDFVNDPSSDG